jgi:hypothetical protein
MASWRHHDPRWIFAGLLCGLAMLAAQRAGAAGPGPNHFLIRGDVVTPDGIMRNAWVDVRAGRILRIQREPPEAADVPVIETTDIVLPGFIDLHNHPSYNVFPRWNPPHKFANRYEWRDSDVYRTTLEIPALKLSDDPANFCDIDEYVEVKALIGGTTSMIGLIWSDRVNSAGSVGLFLSLSLFLLFPEDRASSSLSRF